MISDVTTLAVTALLLFGSPGPGPMTIVATSATFGIRRTISLYLGILLGLGLSMVAASLGLATLLAAWPSLKSALQILGGLYVLYLAYRIATTPLDPNQAGGSCLTLTDGVLLNILNPKSYAVLLVIYSKFLLPVSPVVAAYLMTMLTCMAVAVITNLFWLCLGGAIRPLFQHPAASRRLRFGFAALMVIAVCWALFYS
ncbi:LysE family translocator [Salinicola halimionae]|uniref:LysE family translocator n=1 Tax=Salinicola halimionae TaxID=1949081 RepID=UPI000DA1B44E|nr:LysE family translocator [Salinicola halimionae]